MNMVPWDFLRRSEVLADSNPRNPVPALALVLYDLVYYGECQDLREETHIFL